MAKYGKWIGGGLGWVLGGPIGGINHGKSMISQN